MNSKFIDAKIRDAFNILDELVECNQAELMTKYKDAAIRYSIQLLNNDLIGDSLSIDDISSNDLYNLVYKLRDIRKTWSQNFSKAIILEKRSAKKGDDELARSILEDFVRNCPSPFYIRMANNRIEHYK